MTSKMILGSLGMIVLGIIVSKCGSWIGEVITIIGIFALVLIAAFLPVFIVLDEPKEKE